MHWVALNLQRAWSTLFVAGNSADCLTLYNLWTGGGISLIFRRLMYLTETMSREQISGSYLQGQGHTERSKVDSANSITLYNFRMGGGILLIFHRFVYLTTAMCREPRSYLYLQGQGHRARFKLQNAVFSHWPLMAPYGEAWTSNPYSLTLFKWTKATKRLYLAPGGKFLKRAICDFVLGPVAAIIVRGGTLIFCVCHC